MEQIERALYKSRQNRLKAQPLRVFADAALHSQVFSDAPPRQTKAAHLDPSLLEKHRIITEESDGALTDVYRSLRAQVLQALNQRRMTTLGITSPKHGEGKTLTAINLAIAIAMDLKQTVLLVDVDLRTPAIARYLGLQPTVGLSDYLTRETELSECFHCVERLSILPARSQAGNAAELLTSPRMLQLAIELKRRYPDRVVIYDLPPLLPGGDALGFLPSIESILLVIHDEMTRTTELTRAMKLLSDRSLIGIVLNASP
jgi:protein-tyrosine kinase